MKIVVLSLIFFTSVLFSQEEEKISEREKFPTSLAIQVRGLTNNRIIESPFELNNGTVISTIGMRNGFSIGAIIRRRFTDNLGLELGLTHNKRYFDLSGTILADGSIYKTDFAFTNFELPVNGVVFVRLSNNFYATTGLGFSAIYKPSSVNKAIVDRVLDKRFSFSGFSDIGKFNISINGQFGFEYRTKNDGTFYLGGSTSIPTAPLFEFASEFTDENAGIVTLQYEDIRSPYFTIDIRYFLPKINNKGVQPNKGPIE